ncbi:Single-stranded DNA-binding protein [compost metagenome]
MMTIKIETTGNYRSGVAQKSGKPYFMCQAFAHLPNVPYPQMFDYYASAQSEVLPAGHYECDVTVDVRDGRLSFDVDPRQGRRISTPAPLKAAAQ